MKNKIRHSALSILRILFLFVLFYAAGAFLKDHKIFHGKNGDMMMDDNRLEGWVNAPEFPSDMEWLNTDRPLSVRELKGKIILLDFWTFCCINCMHVIPDLKKLEEKYPDELVVIGVHSAKFFNEKGTESIRQAILRYGIKHPVVNDKDFRIWRAYAVHSWPTLVLINPKGRIIGTQSGEGIFDLFDQVIGHAISYFDSKKQLERGALNLKPEQLKQPDSPLAFPGKIHADPKTNRLFISDSNHHRILIAGEDGKILEIVGSGKLGRADGSFDAAEFNHPQGIFLEGDVLYVADTENHLIRAANLRAHDVKTILGTGQQARGFNQKGSGARVALNSPWDLLVQDGKLYIAMAGPHQLWVADLKTLEAKPFAGSGREARVDGALLDAALAQPSGITTDGKKLYFADSETGSIRSADLDPKGKVETIIGDDLFEFGDIDGDIHTARLQHPLGLIFEEGLLYVTDTYNSKIKVLDPVKKTSRTYAGAGKHGNADGAKHKAEFFEPGGIALLNDRFYIADTNNHSVRILDRKTEQVTTLSLSGFPEKQAGQKDAASLEGRRMDLPEQSASPGKAVVSINFELPQGYKFTAQAPFHLDWESEDEKIVRFVKNTRNLDSPQIKFPYEISVENALGNTSLTVHAVIYYCRESASSLCFFDPFEIHIPVKVQAGGSSRLMVSVPVKPKG